MSEAKVQQPEEDEQLVSQALAGSQNAFRKLYDRYQKRIYRLVGSMINSPEDAGDIVQEVFIRAFASLDSFKGASSFYTWLYRIALNATTDFRRKQARRFQSVPEQPLSEIGRGAMQAAAPGEEGPEGQLYRKELAAMVRKALGTLGKEHREVMVLREINGLSYAEIAEVTGVTIGTVMSRLHYARKKVAETLQRWKVLDQEN